MDDFSQYLVAQARSSVAALHEFMLRFDEESPALHCFFEGEEDPSFYLPHLRKAIPNVRSWHYVCGGKWEVKGVRDHLVMCGYPLVGILFFVDRDFDDYFNRQIQEIPNCYVTDFYSIENYLVGTQEAETILVELAGLAQADKECVRFISSCPRLFDRWYLLVKPLMALTLAARDCGISTNLNNVNLSKLFQISHLEQDLKRKSGALNSYVKDVLPPGVRVPFSRILKWRRLLSKAPAKCWVRGKYELWFFEKLLLSFLEEQVNLRKAAKQKLPRIPSSLREGTLIDALGGRIRTPVSLDAFLKTTPIPSFTALAN